MPPPIMPAPSTPSFFTFCAATPAGREAPFLMALSWYHSVLMMFFDACDSTQAAK
jgi:hypothetical protein